MMAVNAFKIKKELTKDDRLQQRDFLSELIIKLIKKDATDDADSHTLIKVDPEDKGKCAYCAQKKKSKSSAHYYCPGCKQHLHADCYSIHHTGLRIHVVRSSKKGKGGKR
ncbi:hypothetical protein AKO1_002840, partial [Acrasis kona]